jgi:hypothetical protein
VRFPNFGKKKPPPVQGCEKPKIPMGDRIEFGGKSKEYTIYRVATEEREAYSYTVSEWDMQTRLGNSDLALPGDDIATLVLNDKRFDDILQPINRRAAIAHTRKLNGR